MMTRRAASVLVLLLVVSIACVSCTTSSEPIKNQDTVYQVSILKALEVGVFDGDTTFATLEENGDFGLGTFNALDGEMVALDGEFYQVKTDGVPRKVGKGELTPFAVVTFFSMDKEQDLSARGTLDELKQDIDGMLPTRNIVYAIRIEGEFDYVKLRSVPAQTEPYPTLKEVVAEQAVFEHRDIEGTMVGLWFPSYMEGINLADYHFHFLSNDRKVGGHLLDCSLESGKAQIDDCAALDLRLLTSNEFYDADLSEPELDKVGPPPATPE